MNDTEELRKAERLIIDLINSRTSSLWLTCHENALAWLEERKAAKRKELSK
tara:strand:+ start:166 stop:318 length:153 start_codon:yes stop_codon:yes gene_type:complete